MQGGHVGILYGAYQDTQLPGESGGGGGRGVGGKSPKNERIKLSGH